MRFFRTGILVFVVLLAGAAFGFAQTDAHDIDINITGFVVIDLSDDTTITLSVTAPVLPGDDPQGDTNNTKDLFYTVVTPVATPQKVSAQITAGGMPVGTDLQLVVDNMGTTSGTPTAFVTLDDLASHDIITAIASTASGRVPAAPNAPRLNYTLVIDPATIVSTAAATTITVTFTIGP